MKKKICLFLVLVLTVCMFAGCAQEGGKDASSSAEQVSAEKKTVELTDQNGRTVMVEYPVERIACMQHHSLDILTQLGAQEQIVCTEDKWMTDLGSYMKDVFPGIEELPTAGTLSDPNVEAIAALDPDLVILAAQCNEDAVAQFEKLGIPNIQNTIPDKDLNFFIVRKDDLALVNYAIEKTMERGRVINEVNFGVMAKDNLQNEDGRPLYSYKGLDEIQKKGILEEAKNRGFTISSQYHEDSKTYDIYFKEKDRDKVRDAYSHIRTMELGKTGERYVNEMERSLDNMRHILKESSRPLKVGEERDFYIVSPNNIHRNIHVQDQEFEHLSEAPNRKRVLRHFEGKGKELERQLYREIATMKNPIIIPKKEWEETRNDPEKRKTLIREKQESYRYSSYEDRQMAQKERDLRMLIEQKMSLDNGDQIENVSSFYNGEVGIHEFFAHEIVNRTHEEEIDQDVQDNEKRFNLESLKESEREQLREYGESILATYKDLAEPEQYYPDREMVMNSLDELLKNAQAQQIDHEVTKSIEEELFR